MFFSDFNFNSYPKKPTAFKFKTERKLLWKSKTIKEQTYATH